MKASVLILLVIAACFGCTNSNVYSRGETPPWYLEEEDTYCSNTTEETQECVS